MAGISEEPRAYQWALPERLAVPPDELRVRLDFYHDTVVMHLVEDGVITTRMVSARDVAMALLREVPLNSGLLPEGALWWGQGRDVGRRGSLEMVQRYTRSVSFSNGLRFYKPPLG